MAVRSEELFLDLFGQVFGPEKTNYLFPQYSFEDIYNQLRYADFVIENRGKRIAIELDGEAVHNQTIISPNKFDDDHVKQNSMVNKGWEVYRWSYRKLLKAPETVKDEMITFLGNSPKFKAVEDYLPNQKAQTFSNSLVLKEHQEEALRNLEELRKAGNTIALIEHATGVGKTVTAITDAQRLGGRTLFIAHTTTLVIQARDAFLKLWPTKDVGLYVDGTKETNAFNLCASIQSLGLNLDDFNPQEFDYIIVDEAHHASSEVFQKVIAYFEPKFLLGLTATPERADGVNILETFVNVAHKLDIKTAVELKQLVPVRCIRVKTNIDISKVRYNGVKYNSQELEKCLFIPERNKLIADNYAKYCAGKPTVVFCVSVEHAKTIANLLCEAGFNAAAVHGTMSSNERAEILEKYEKGIINVLCACDILNEGWDSPKTEILFMARPTMSKVLYMQQLGRGMRLYPGKTHLLVFDFVDNAGMFNAPYSLHVIFAKKVYHPGGVVVGPKDQIEADDELYRRLEKPQALIDYPIDVKDYELIDVFNWQNEAEGMNSQMAFVQKVDVQRETIDKYIKNGKIKPTLIVDISEHTKINYFSNEDIEKYAKEFGWRLIDNATKKELFIEYITNMDMTYSYKPLFLKAFFKFVDNRGRARLEDIVNYVMAFYNARKEEGLITEKSSSVFGRDFTKAEAQRNILTNPFKRFEQMSMMRHTKTLGTIELDSYVFKKLTKDEINWIIEWSDKKLKDYFELLN